jgi:BolA family transcriptional regulator, general stress-responsive regulator
MVINDEIKQKIETKLIGSKVDVIDNSAAHLGHGASGSHLEVIVAYKGFKNKSLIEQHRMINDILKDELKEKIHALKITTKVE